MAAEGPKIADVGAKTMSKGMKSSKRSKKVFANRLGFFLGGDPKRRDSKPVVPVRDIDINHLKLEEIILGFPEIINYSINCAFPNCSHQADEGCAVIAALKNGDIEESRYNNFIFLSNRELNE